MGRTEAGGSPHPLSRSLAIGVGVAALLGLVFLSHAARAGELHDLARSGNVPALALLLQRDPDQANLRDEHGYPPLHVAVRAGQRKTAALLLINGADPNGFDGEGVTPLHRAGQYDRPEMVALLVGSGAEVDLRGEDHLSTPLWVAVSEGNWRVLEALLAAGADPNRRGLRGGTPLEKAATLNDQGVAILLAAGADSNSRDVNQNVALHYALYNRQWRNVVLLLNAGADPNALTLTGRNALHLIAVYAGANNPAGLARRLMTLGVDPRLADRWGDTPLDLAVRTGRTDLARLFSGGDAEDVDCPDADFARETGVCPIPPASACQNYVLFESVAETDLETALEVLAQQEDPLDQYCLGANIFLYSIRSQPIRYIEELLKVGLDPQRRMVQEVNPLDLAMMGDNPEVFQLFIQSGADPNGENMFGGALHLAANGGHEAMAEALLENKAIFGPRFGDGLTPFHLALLSGSRRLIEMLAQLYLEFMQSLDGNAANRQNWTPSPIEFVQQYGYEELVVNLNRRFPEIQ